jgi:propionyl-CoA carboxylase beta chain
LPSNNADEAPRIEATDPVDRPVPEVAKTIPSESDKPYDMASVVRAAVDDGTFLQAHENYARNMLTGFARIGGRVVGIVANQPAHLAGVLDIAASIKAARFVRFCDCFNIPVVTLVDVPGFLPGVDQEHGGIILHGAKLLFAYCEATVPKVTVIVRKAYGGAYDVMSSKHLRGDVNFAFPQAEIAVMGPSAAVNVIHRREIQGAVNPEHRRAELVREYRAQFASPARAAALGYIDEIIDPVDLRRRLAGALSLLQTKRLQNPPKKHSNEPL